MNWRHWLTHPYDFLLRLKYYAWERRHPDLPWLCPATVDFCEEVLMPQMRVLEYGSGRSTAWFARQVGEVTSVEHNADWYRAVEGRLARDGITNVDYRLVPLDHPEPEGEHEAYDPMPAYVRVADEFGAASLDVVLVDGHYRTHCIRRVVPKIKPGGYLVVDDVNLWPEITRLPVPAEWEIVNEGDTGLKRAVIWRAR